MTHVFSRGGALHVPEGTEVPTDSCVRCGRPSKEVISKMVRKPLNPLTWYTKQTAINIGLCKKHIEDRKVGVALTYSLLGLGVIFVIAGAISISIGMIAFGLVAIVVSGYFRARIPIYRSEPEGWILKVEGAGKGFLKQLPVYEGTDGV